MAISIVVLLLRRLKEIFIQRLKLSVHWVCHLKSYLNCALFALFIVCLGARITGIFEHEILGLILCAGILIHCFKHGSWFFSLTKGWWSLRRILSSLVNYSLIVGFALILGSGILISPDIFRFLDIEAGVTARLIHSVAAFWTLVLLGLHLGLHGSMVGKKIERIIGAGTLIPTSIFIIAIGSLGFVDRMLFEKLFLGFAFDFWDPSRPILLYFVLYASICGALSIIIHTSLHLSVSKNELNKKF